MFSEKGGNAMDDTHVEIMLKDALEMSAEGYGGQTEAIAVVALVLIEINKNLDSLTKLLAGYKEPAAEEAP